MTTLYQQSIPVLVKYLKNLSFLLQKGAKFCEEKTKFLASRFGAPNIPTFEDNEETFEHLQERIAKTIEVLENVDPDVINGKEDVEIIMESKTPDVDSSQAVRTAHVQDLMDRLRSKSPIYNFIMAEAQLIESSQGVVTTRMTLNENHLNSSGNLHGAVSATIIDFVTGLAIASWDLRETTGASVDMHISYVSTARLGDVVEIVSTADKVGGSVAFSSIKIFKVEADGALKLVTHGQHTKYVKNSQPKASLA
ncbi:hypothetical protein ACHAP4_000075 [Fusarium culmorum]